MYPPYHQGERTRWTPCQNPRVILRRPTRLSRIFCKEGLELVPQSSVLQLTGHSLSRYLQILHIEVATLSDQDPLHIQEILGPAWQELEQNKILRRRKASQTSVQAKPPGAPPHLFLQRRGGRQAVDGDPSVDKPEHAGFPQLPLDRPDIGCKSMRLRLAQERWHVSRGKEDEKVEIVGQPRLTEHAHSEGADDQIAALRRVQEINEAPVRRLEGRGDRRG